MSVMSDSGETQERKRCRTDSSARADDGSRSRTPSEAGKPSASSPADTDATDAAVLLESVAGCVSNVNREVIQLLQTQVRSTHEQMQRQVSESTAATATAVKLSKDLVHKHGQLIAAEATVDDLRHAVAVKTQLLEAGFAQLQERVCHAAAAGNLVKAASVVASAEVATLAQINAKLMETCIAQERERMGAAERWQQELLRAQRESKTAQLQCQLLLSDRRRLVDALGAKQEETMRLMDLVERMSERNKNELAAVESATQSRALVRLLEQQLSLDGIVRAVIPPDSELHAQARAAAASHVTRGPPPDPRIKDVAPDFFALRLLEYRDVSIAELVSEWQRQDEELRREKAAHGATVQQLERLQRDASKTHCLYLEERRRREAESRRLGELQRQRISGTPGALNDFDQLRLEHSTALDNVAMLTVHLQQLRDETHRLQQREQQLEATVADLRAEAQLSGVAQAVANAKLHYERQVQQLAQMRHAAENERDIQKVQLDQHREQLTALRDECDDLRRAAAASTATLSSLQNLKDSQERLLRDTVSSLRASKAASLSPASPIPASLGAATKPPEHGAAPLLIFHLVAALGDLEKAVAAQLRHELETGGGGGSASEDGATRDSSSTTELRRVLRESLRFTAEQLAATERLRTHFAEQQLADSACVHAFYERLEQARSERDRVTQELESAQRLIERHSLHAAEAILMHEVDRSVTTTTASSSSSFVAQSGSPGSPPHHHPHPHQQQHGGGPSVEAELTLLRHELHEKHLLLAKAEAALLQREQELQAQLVEVSRSRAAAKSSAREAAWWKATMEAERLSQQRLAEQLHVLRNQFVVRAEAFALECEDATALHRQILRAARQENSSATAGDRVAEARETRSGERAEDENRADVAPDKDECPAAEGAPPEAAELVSSSPGSQSTERVDELTDVESINVDDEDEMEEAFDEEEGDEERSDDDEYLVAEATAALVAAVPGNVGGECEGFNSVTVHTSNAEAHAQQEQKPSHDEVTMMIPCATLEEWTEQTKSEMDSISPLLRGIASTLSDVKAAVLAIARPKEDNASLSTRTVNHEADATRTLDDAVEEKLRSDGIHAVVGIVRDIYETCNLVQQRRAALHGEDKSQAAETTSLALETLRRKCAGLEEVAARSTQTLAQEREEFTKQLQYKTAQLQQLQIEADKSLRASQEHAALNHRLQQQLADRQMESQRLAQELEKKDAMNRKLLELVNALKGKVLTANSTAAAVAPVVVAPPPTVPSPPPPMPTQALPPSSPSFHATSSLPELPNPESSVSNMSGEAESTV